MTNLREYNMNGTIILGVDAGYGNFKTARTCFPTSVTKSMSEPTISKDYVEYNGAYYILGDGHNVCAYQLDGMQLSEAVC